MKGKTNRTLVVCVLLGASLAAPAFAILGLGDIVFDPTNFEEAVQQLLEMEQQYAQLVQSNQTLRNQYNQMLWMAKQVPVNMAARYRAVATPWQASSATNIYGTAGNWITGVNTGVGVDAGYAVATQPLSNYGAALGNIPADQLPRVKTNYATVELTDGANLSGMETIGRLRANSGAVEMAIQDLEDDSLSSDPDMNTEIAVLNKINAAHLISVRNTQDTNKLLVALAEEQIIDAKRKRDAEAQAINNHIRFASEGKAVMAAQASGASEAMLAWRMP
jgi:type IV secretion system protein TrbJ